MEGAWKFNWIGNPEVKCFLLELNSQQKQKVDGGALKLNINLMDYSMVDNDNDYFCADSKKWKMGGFALNLEIQILLPDDRLMKERIWKLLNRLLSSASPSSNLLISISSDISKDEFI